MLLNVLKVCCGPLAQAGPLGFIVMFLALAGPILLLTGGLMFAIHQPQSLVSGNGTLVAVQSDRFWPDPLPDTYSWCRYSMLVNCPEDGAFDVPTRARRDDTDYNGLQQVSAARCFEDAEFLNEADAGPAGFTPAACLQSDGSIICTNPHPIIRAYHDKDGCSNGVWTLNDPQESITRFVIILSVGGGCFIIGWGAMLFFWIAGGCPTDGDEIVM